MLSRFMDVSKINGRQYTFALLLFMAVTFFYEFPAVLNLDTHFVGSPRGDKFQFIWNFWWVRYAINELGQMPFFCPLQYYPTGVSLALHDTTYFWSFLSVPLQSIFDLRTILNLFLLLCFPLNAMAFYHLARTVTGNHRGAIIGSLLFAFCPYLVGRFHVGHIQYLGVFFMPLLLLEVYRYSRNHRRRHMVTAGIYFWLTALISYYYAAALTLVLSATCIYKIIISRNETGQLRALAIDVTIFIVLTAALLSWFVVPALIQLIQGDYQFVPEVANNAVANSGDLISYFIPDTTLSSWMGWEVSEKAARWARGVNETLGGNILEKSVYPGWTSLAALLAALTWRPLRRACWAWVLLAISFFILSLGPTLHFNGTPYLEGLMPYHWLSSFPLFSIMRSPSRLSIFIILGAGLIIASGCQHIKPVSSRRGYNIATNCLALFVLIEFLPVPAYLTSNNYFRSPYYHKLFKDPVSYSVLNIPVDFTAAKGGGDIYLYAQTIHNKPIIGGYVSRESDDALKTLTAFPFLSRLMRQPWGGLGGGACQKDCKSAFQEMITRLNVGHVILHRALLTPQEQAVIAEMINSVLGRPVFEDQWIIVFNAFGEDRERP